MSSETVLILRTCDANLRSRGGFQWPASGYVEAPDWNPIPECGYGLHGLLWGEGESEHLNFNPAAKGLVVRVDKDSVVDLNGKVKFPSGTVVFCGTLKEAADYISANGGQGRAVVMGTSTSGDRGTSNSGDRGTSTSGAGGTSTSGYRGTSNSGDRGTSNSGYRGTSNSGAGGTSNSGDYGTSNSGDYGTSTSGYRGTSTSGYYGTSTSGDYGTSTSGAGGIIAIKYWNGKRYKVKVGHVKDEDGEGELEPNTPYRLNEAGEFVVADGGAR